MLPLPKSRFIIVWIWCVTVLPIFFSGMVASIPIGKTMQRPFTQKTVAWAEFKKDATQGHTVSGFVIFSQAQSPIPHVIVYGAWDTGFDDPEIQKYSLVINPTGYDLSGKFEYKIRGTGTEPWLVTIHDMSLTSNIEGATLVAENLFEIQYDGKTIGAAPIKIVGC